MTTSFQDMRDLVNGLTKRPELVAVTDLAIRLATTRAHHVDFFSRDAAATLLTYTPPTSNQIYVDVADIYTTVSQLRTPDFLQSEDLVTYLPTETLEFVPSFKEFWDMDQELRTSVFTFIGTTLRFRALSATGRARLFHFVNPVTTAVGYASWIADNHPDELAAWAAAIVWQRSGFQEIAVGMQRDFIEPFKALLVESYLSSKH